MSCHLDTVADELACPSKRRLPVTDAGVRDDVLAYLFLLNSFFLHYGSPGMSKHSSVLSGYAWHGTRPSHCLGMRPALRHTAPGSLSQLPNRQESLRLSCFCLSSSRSLGRCLLLGQRSRMNFFSHYIRSLVPQDHR